MTDPITAASIANEVGQAAVKAVLTEFGGGLRRSLSSIGKRLIDELIVSFEIGFDEFLSQTYNKCKFYKTILNPNEPLDIFTNYLHSNLKFGNTEINDELFFRDISISKRIIVTGLAGSGKSMMMKYIAIREFEYPSGRIPLLIELRKMNSLSQTDFLTFIRSACSGPSGRISEQQFLMALKTGAFLIIIDGFDELNVELKNSIQEQIINLTINYPNCCIVMSSRPDERFGNWHSFKVYQVSELNNDQIIEFVNLLNYDRNTKKRFLSELKNGLIETHNSFLKYPLLATIMLLTYNEYAEIPRKMHAFYELAFETLIRKHDASKDQFKRLNRSGLTNVDFKSCFAAFCGMSYFYQTFSFKDIELEGYAQRSIDYIRNFNSNIDQYVTAENFVLDLFETVCMIQRDGIESVFVHRSFQEYFAALFITKLAGPAQTKFLNACAGRSEDSVIELAVEIAPEIIEKNWVIPTINYLIQEIWDDTNLLSPALKVDKLLGSCFMIFFNDSFKIMDGETMDNILLLDAVLRIYGKHVEGFSTMDFLRGGLRKHIIRENENPDNEQHSNYKDVLSLIENNTISTKSNVKPTRIKKYSLTSNDDWWFDMSGASAILSNAEAALKAIKDGVLERDRKREDILDLLLTSSNTVPHPPAARPST